MRIVANNAHEPSDYFLQHRVEYHDYNRESEAVDQGLEPEPTDLGATIRDEGLLAKLLVLLELFFRHVDHFVMHITKADEASFQLLRHFLFILISQIPFSIVIGIDEKIVVAFCEIRKACDAIPELSGH
jgi:hypothetical protein